MIHNAQKDISDFSSGNTKETDTFPLLALEHTDGNQNYTEIEQGHHDPDWIENRMPRIDALLIQRIVDGSIRLFRQVQRRVLAFLRRHRMPTARPRHRFPTILRRA
jgi:hypothetical protein